MKHVSRIYVLFDSYGHMVNVGAKGELQQHAAGLDRCRHGYAIVRYAWTRTEYFTQRGKRMRSFG